MAQTDGLAATAAISLLEVYRERTFSLADGYLRPHTPCVARKKCFEPDPPDSIPLPGLSDEDRQRVPAPAFASAPKGQDAVSDDLRRRAKSLAVLRTFLFLKNTG